MLSCAAGCRASWRSKWSPEEISARLGLEFPGRAEMRVSHETIYQSLYVQGRGALRRELAASLRTGRALRKPRRTDGERRGKIPGMVNISERPAEAADRAVPGHWEGDLLIGANGRSAIGTLVERTTRFTMLVPLPAGRDAPAVADALTPVIAGLPDAVRRSLTWDQGWEMRAHARIAVDADCEIYFCDPHAPWQRGSNENTNGLLRQYFPKGTSLAGHTPADLAAVADELNGRPRKTLGWKTPAEALAEILDSQPRLSPGRTWRWRLAPPLISREGRRAVSGAAPPASRLLRIACGDGPAGRPDPGDLCGPGGRHQGPGPRGLPPPAHGTPRGPRPHKVNTERVIYRHCCNDPLIRLSGCLARCLESPRERQSFAGPGGAERPRRCPRRERLRGRRAGVTAGRRC